MSSTLIAVCCLSGVLLISRTDAVSLAAAAREEAKGPLTKIRQHALRPAWSGAGGDFRNTGRGGSNVLKGKIKWIFGQDGPTAAGVAISSKGDIYFNLSALHSDRTFEWAASTDPEEFCEQPTIGPDGTVYFALRGSVLAFSSKGRRLWKMTGPMEGWDPSIGKDGTLYFTTPQGLLAITPGGRLKWSKQFGGTYRAPPAIGIDGNLFFGSYDHHIYCVTPRGRVVWTYLTKWKCGAPITIGDNGRVYAPSGDGTLYVLSRLGKLLWKFDPGGSSLFRGGSLARDGTYYLAGSDCSIYCLTPAGHLRWICPSAACSPPAIGLDGVIYAAYRQIRAIKPNGRLLWSVNVDDFGNSTALSSDGQLLVTLSKGQLCSIE